MDFELQIYKYSVCYTIFFANFVPMKREVIQPVVIAVLLIILVIICIGLSMALYGRTLMPWWLLPCVGVGVGLAAAAAPSRRWCRLLALKELWLGRAVQFAVAGTLGAFLVAGANYWGVSGDTCREVTATVVGRAKQQHTRYRPGVKGRSRPAGTYYTYKLQLDVPGYGRYDKPVGVDKYVKTRNGSRIRVEVAEGLLGFPVILHD